MMLPSLDDLALFVAVADEGGFTAAATRLSLPKSTVSRRLGDLEARLRVTLFHRTTRALSLTDEGRRIHEIAAPAIAAARLAATAVAQRDQQVAGRVVITATAALAQHLIAPRLAAMTAAYPEVQIELRLSEQRIDIVGEGVDLAVRMGALEDSSLIARRLCTVRRFLVASPRYVSAAGTPLTPADLAAHRTIVTSPALDVWHLADDWNCEIQWTIAAGNMLVAHALAWLDQGIALLPDFLVNDDLRSGTLVTVLDDYVDDRADAWIVTSPQRYRSAAVKAVIEHLARLTEK